MRRAIFLLLFASSFATASVTTQSVTPPRVEWGINVDDQFPYRQSFDRATEGHFGWVRIWFTWTWLEAKPGEIDWSNMDSQGNWARARGLKILASFTGIPTWVNGSNPDCNIWKRGDCVPPPPDSSAWTNFLGKVVARYHNDVHYWNLWNEPNLGTFWSGSINQFISLILVPGYQTVKGIDPEAKIVGPELSHAAPSFVQTLRGDTRFDWHIWARDLFRYGNGYLFDVISHHVYKKTAADVAKALDAFHEVAVHEGQGRKPFWLNETAFNSCEFNEETQKNEVNKLVDELDRRSWMQNAFYFDLADGKDFETTKLCGGLTHPAPAEETKPAFHEFARRLPKPGQLEPFAPYSPTQARYLLDRMATAADGGDPTADALQLNWYEWSFMYDAVTGGAPSPSFTIAAQYSSRHAEVKILLLEWWTLAQDMIRLDPSFGQDEPDGTASRARRQR